MSCLWGKERDSVSEVALCVSHSKSVGGRCNPLIYRADAKSNGSHGSRHHLNDMREYANEKEISLARTTSRRPIERPASPGIFDTFTGPLRKVPCRPQNESCGLMSCISCSHGR